VKVGITITGARDVAARLEKIGPELRDSLREVISRETAAIYASVKPPRGATGQTAAALRWQVNETAQSIVGRVYFAGPGPLKARIGALEYGTKGKRAQVRLHRRRLTHVFGRSIAPMQVLVDKYQRRPNIAARRFLRGAFDARRPQLEAALQQAINRTVS
jgi:hypothetical protein